MDIQNNNTIVELTLRLTRSTMFKKMKLAAICVTNTRSDELFVVNDDPVFVKIFVT